MNGQQDAVIKTVSAPDLIQQGDFGGLLAARRYSGTALGDKFLVVAYREVDRHDGFVLTAYYTRRLSAQREILWKR